MSVPLRSHAIERELKFAVAPSDVAKLEVHPLLAPFRRRTQPLLSTYFDTANRALDKAGLSLRVRASGNRILQTLKRQVGPSNGLFVRPEDEIERAEPEPDLAHLLRHCPAKLRKELGAPLEPVFRVEVRRTEWRPIAWKASELSVSLDEGVIRSGDGSRPLSELEIELLHGDLEAAFDVARQIARVVPLHLEVAAKSERGYRLSAGTSMDAEKARPVKLERNLTTAAGFQAIASACIHHFAANATVFSATRAPEALHQMRVAIRRLRSLVSFCKDLLSERELATLRAGMRRVFKTLGEARDLDIVLEALGKDGAETDGARSDPAALADLGRKHRAAYARVAAMLESRRFCLCMIDLLAFVACGAWIDPEDEARRELANRKLHRGAARILRRQWKKLRRFGRLSRLGPERRHRFRIRVKAFRYACEFFGGLFAEGGQKRRRNHALDILGALQDDLGALNDLVSMRRLLDEPPGPEGGGRAGAANGNGATERALLQAADAAQRRLYRQRPFWS